jgi:hypothetical protein
MILFLSKPVPPGTRNELGFTGFSRTGTLACPVLLHWQREDSQEWLSYTTCWSNRKWIAMMQGFGGKARLRFANLKRLQFLAGLEAHRFSWGDADFLAGSWIAANAGLTRAHVEHSETAQLDPFAFAERVLHGFKNGFDRLLRLRPAHSGLIYDGINNVQLNHTSLPLLNGKLC